MGERWRRASVNTRAVVAAYVVLSGVQLAVALGRWLTEHHKHYIAPAGVAGVAVLLVAVWGMLTLAVLWRHRWAWAVVTALSVFGVLSFTWEPGRAAESLAFDIAALVLLLSPPMRRYVGVRRPAAVSPSV